MDSIADLINKYGFPIVAAAGMGYFIYYVWTWVTTEIKPVIGQANGTLIALIDRIRMLDNDLIRLNQKVETVMELRGKTIEHERIEADKDINQRKKKNVEEDLPIGKRKATPKEVKEAAGDD
jgi:hypothetical protein